MKNWKQNKLPLLGGVLFLLMFFLSGGVFRLLNWSSGVISAEEWGDKLAAIFFLAIGIGLMWYGLKVKNKKIDDEKA